MASYYLNENGVDRFLLEDGSGLLLTEASASTSETEGSIANTTATSGVGAKIILTEGTESNSFTASGAGTAVTPTVGVSTCVATTACVGAFALAANGVTATSIATSGAGATISATTTASTGSVVTTGFSSSYFAAAWTEVVTTTVAGQTETLVVVAADGAVASEAAVIGISEARAVVSTEGSISPTVGVNGAGEDAASGATIIEATGLVFAGVFVIGVGETLTPIVPPPEYLSPGGGGWRSPFERVKPQPPRRPVVETVKPDLVKIQEADDIEVVRILCAFLGHN